MSLKIKYVDVPYGAQQGILAQGEGQPFSNPQTAAVGFPDVAYATLEPFGWPLDGSRQILPDQPDAFWWSAVRSDSSGTFLEPPVLTFSLDAVYTATGLSFSFWPSVNEWCSKARISWYRGAVLLAQSEIAPTAHTWTLQQTVEGFDKIRVELLETNIPESFAKLRSLTVGQSIWFDQDAIQSVSLLNEIDPMLSQLTVDTMTVNLHNTAGYALLPQENQKIELYRDNTLLAVQYVSEGSRETAQSYRFSCQSAVCLLADDYLGGIYTAVPIHTLLQDILNGLPYVLDSVFQNTVITGYLPICTRREALQQVAFVIGAVVTTHGGETIRLVPPECTVGSRFPASHLFHNSRLNTEPRFATVEVVSHSYIASAEEEVLLENEPLSGESVMFSFSTPHWGYAISGGTITGSGANWVTVTANRQVTLTGKKYLHSTTRHTRNNTDTSVKERSNVLSVDAVTLINSSNAASVLERLCKTAQLRQTLTNDAVITGQAAGQMVTLTNPWGRLFCGYITAMDSQLTPNGHTAAITVLGTETAAEIAAFYSGEAYSGSGEVVY